jgi:hypothetical protein
MSFKQRVLAAYGVSGSSSSLILPLLQYSSMESLVALSNAKEE